MKTSIEPGYARFLTWSKGMNLHFRVRATAGHRSIERRVRLHLLHSAAVTAQLFLITLAGVLLLPVVSEASTSLDRGRSRPPAKYQGIARQYWKIEWAVCGGDTMEGLAKEVGVRNIRAYTPQYAARRLAYVIERGVYRPRYFEPTFDGCRNGILYRYYHL